MCFNQKICESPDVQQKQQKRYVEATGPPRSGAGVGVAILMGGCGFLGIPKIQQIDLPKIPRFHADPTLLGNPKDSKK